MIRIELDPIQFYGLGLISQRKELSGFPEKQKDSHWIIFQLENSIWKSLLFRVPVTIDEMMAEELTNILASRISTALSKAEETWVGISPPCLLTHTFSDPQTIEDYRIEFEFRYAGNGIPVVASLHPREVAYA